MMNSVYSVAIDGPAGAGKSTVAKAAAAELGFMYLDTGAMYRTIGLYFTRAQLLNDDNAIANGAKDIDISVRFIDGVQKTYMNGEDVTELIRTPEASAAASRVAAFPEVRERLVALQQQIACNHSIVMDGRDIGTKVLPNATVKIYLTASPEARAQRRYNEMKEKDPSASYENVLDDIIKRDYNDMHRAASPLVQAEDALLVDTSDMTAEQSVDAVVRVCRSAIKGA